MTLVDAPGAAGGRVLAAAGRAGADGACEAVVC
jgi:hypothetical protein